MKERPVGAWKSQTWLLTEQQTGSGRRPRVRGAGLVHTATQGPAGGRRGQPGAWPPSPLDARLPCTRSLTLAPACRLPEAYRAGLASASSSPPLGTEPTEVLLKGAWLFSPVRGPTGWWGPHRAPGTLADISLPTGWLCEQGGEQAAPHSALFRRDAGRPPRPAAPLCSREAGSLGDRAPRPVATMLAPPGPPAPPRPRGEMSLLLS